VGRLKLEQNPFCRYHLRRISEYSHTHIYTPLKARCAWQYRIVNKKIVAGFWYVKPYNSVHKYIPTCRMNSLFPSYTLNMSISLKYFKNLIEKGINRSGPLPMVKIMAEILKFKTMNSKVRRAFTK
jgi:hypothetical protein